MNELKVQEFEGKLVTDSREVAEMVGKEHKHLMRDIKGYIEVLRESNFGLTDFFIESSYVSNQNKTLPCYLLTKKGCNMTANKMTGDKGVLFTATYVTRFEEMENQLKNQTPTLPTTYKEALQKLLIEVEKNEQLEIENKELVKEVEYKEDVIVGLVDEITLAEKRQLINRVVRSGGQNKTQERWTELYKQFEQKYHINLKLRLERYNQENKPKLKNRLDYIDKKLSKIPELYEIACKLYENDIKALMDELYGLQN